ncbi:MAG: hypothetical protein LBV60_26120, partial [Streptomyces sp.]|nr:hypothetical protein [Streptomyces sp.]
MSSSGRGGHAAESPCWALTFRTALLRPLLNGATVASRTTEIPRPGGHTCAKVGRVGDPVRT